MSILDLNAQTFSTGKKNSCSSKSVLGDASPVQLTFIGFLAAPVIQGYNRAVPKCVSGQSN